MVPIINEPGIVIPRTTLCPHSRTSSFSPGATSLAHALTAALGRTQSSPSSPDHRDSPAAPAPLSREPSLPKPLPYLLSGFPYLNMPPTTVTIGQLDGADDAPFQSPARAPAKVAAATATAIGAASRHRPPGHAAALHRPTGVWDRRARQDGRGVAGVVRVPR